MLSSLQLEATVPTVVLDEAKLTVPVGVFVVFVVSVTVTVHIEFSFTPIVEGLQLTAVDVVSGSVDAK